jgi:phosphoribosyl 1,2-cyclic phosphodiesterase
MMRTQEPGTFVTFWGTRGSVSTPGRVTEKYGGNTPCVTIRHGSTIFILDAGTGIRNLGIDLIQESEKQGTPLALHLFLSHTHWDHIQGLPFFQPAYENNTKLTIYGSATKGGFLASILKGQMDYEYFPVSMAAFEADITIKEISGEAMEVGPIKVDWQEQTYHAGGSVRYRFHIDGKSIVYATDVELDRIFQAGFSPKDQEILTQEYIDFVQGADLLIADGQYTSDEYLCKVGWGHSSISVVSELATKAEVGQLAIFHHDPQHSDKILDDLWMKSRIRYGGEDVKTDIFWAREGLTLAI